MQRSPFGPLQVASYNRLGTATDYTVVDVPPEGQGYPYITIGEIYAVPRLTKQRPGTECMPTVHLWSRYRGYEQLAEMESAVIRALTERPLEVHGFEVVTFSLDFATRNRDKDGETMHSTIRFRSILMDR
jgi:hypothetical protein